MAKGPTSRPHPDQRKLPFEDMEPPVSKPARKAEPQLDLSRASYDDLKAELARRDAATKAHNLREGRRKGGLSRSRTLAQNALSAEAVMKFLKREGYGYGSVKAAAAHFGVDRKTIWHKKREWASKSKGPAHALRRTGE